MNNHELNIADRSLIKAAINYYNKLPPKIKNLITDSFFKALKMFIINKF